MAAEVSSFLEPCSKELNVVTQLVAWLMIRKKFYNPETHGKWHRLLNGLCGFFLLEDMTLDTAHLLTVLSLLSSLHSDEKDADAQHAKAISRLLRRIVLFPELESYREVLEALQKEADCQVILQCCRDSGNEQALALMPELFGPISSDPSDSNYSELGHTLCQLLKRRKSKASTTDLEKFIAEHSMSRLRTELLDVLYAALSNLNTFSVYNSFDEQVISQLPQTERMAKWLHREEEEEGENGDEEEEREVEEGQEEVGGNQEGEEVLNDRDDEQDRGEDYEAVGEVVEEGEGGDSVVEIMEDTEQEEAPNESEHVIQPESKRMRNTPDGEEIEWESSDATTPPSHLPSRRSITARNRSSLVGATAVRRVTYKASPTTSSPRGQGQTWSHTETENLLKGVRQFGIGRWKLILDNYEFSSRRTAVSLKDKWRNLRGRYNKQ